VRDPPTFGGWKKTRKDLNVETQRRREKMGEYGEKKEE
jgi:hypothetical protein